MHSGTYEREIQYLGMATSCSHSDNVTSVPVLIQETHYIGLYTNTQEPRMRLL